jgi:P-type Cu+ transporter
VQEGDFVEMKQIVLKIDGMMCQKNCGTTVQNALMSVHGVHSANVSFATHSASILLSDNEPSLDASKLIQVVDDIGFEATLIEATKPSHVFKVFGMMCQKNCGSTVENALRNVPGVLWAKVDFPSQTAEVWDNNSIADQNVFKDAVEDVGFEVLFDGPMTKESTGSGGDEEPDSIYLSEKKITQLDIPKIRELLLSIDGVLSLDIDLPHHLIKVWGFADTPFVQKMLKDSGFPTHVFQSLNDALNYQNERKQRMASPPSTLPIVEKVIQDNGHTFVANLLVGGMSCANCAKSIETNLTKRAGILSIRVALLSGRVEVVYDETTFGKFDQLPQIIKSLGYSAKFEGDPHRYGSLAKKRSKKLRVKISGMSCGSSAKEIENAVKQLKGVLEADVSIKTNLGNFVLEDSSLNGGVGPRAVIEEIERMGYWCKHVPSQDQDDLGKENMESADIQEWWRLLLIALVFGIPVMLLHLSMMMSSEMMMMLDQPGMCDGSLSRNQTLMAFLNTPLQIIVGYRFYRGAFLSAMHGSFGMDCLVVTGTTITFVYSSLQFFFACYSGVSTQHMFFETSGMLLMFVTIGKYIEAYAKGATASAMTSLLKLQPRKAFLVSNMVHSPLGESYTTTSTASSSPPTPTNTIDISDDDWIENEVKEIDIELIDRNDIIKVFPGERFPTDGEVVRGSSYVDESLITGESVPVLRGVGSTVYGSTVNQKGLIYIRVTSLGDDTALSQIVKMIEAAQMNKAPIQAYADQVAGVFTPTVLALAVVTFLVWFVLASNHLIPVSWMREAGYGKDSVLFSLLFSISVVVISCPCALGLATPTAIMVSFFLTSKKKFHDLSSFAIPFLGWDLGWRNKWDSH